MATYEPQWFLRCGAFSPWLVQGSVFRLTNRTSLLCGVFEETAQIPCATSGNFIASGRCMPPQRERYSSGCKPHEGLGFRV